MSATLPELRPGSIVAWWNGQDLAFGLVAGEDKQRLRLVPARGKEQRVPPSRIAFEIEGPGGTATRFDVQRVEQVERLVNEEVARVDVPLLWQVVTESDSGAEPVLTTEQLAGLAFEPVSSRAQAAIVLALLRDGLHFMRRPEGFVPRTAAAVHELRGERRRIAQREQDRDRFFRALAATVRGSAFERSGGETEREYLDALERLALDPDAIPDAVRQSAMEALEASSLRWDRPHEGAFRLLRRIGRFTSDDENLQVPRFGLRTEFPAEVLALATIRGSSDWERSGRRDLASARTFSIDGPHTREIDDLLSVERRDGGGFRLGVHIADPCAFVFPEDALDREASTRGLTHYMPGLRLPMLPPAISEEAASLVALEPRPALSFLVDLTRDGRVDEWELTRSVLRSHARFDYDAADRIVAGDPSNAFAQDLTLLAEVGRLLREDRKGNGALVILAPEVEVFVDETGEPALERLPADSPSRCAVSESMILAGALAARFCVERGLPVVYRRQAAPSERPELPGDGAWDPVLIRRARRVLRRAEVGLEPGPHAGLGLAAYVQVSSPLRRFQDLAIHRQILAALGGEEPCYDREAMQRIASTSERSDQDARRAEQAADEYWMLRYLEKFTGLELDAVVVETLPRPVIQLLDTLWEQPMNGISGVAPGERIRVEVQSVNPRARRISLRPVGVAPSRDG